MATMEQLIEEHWTPAVRAVRSEARRWHVPACERDDVVQETFAKLLQYPPDLAGSRDPDKFFFGSLRVKARSVIMDRLGYHNGTSKPQSARAAGDQAMLRVGVFQAPEQEGGYMDERILGTMPSAEDVYLATVPSKRQTALRGAVEALPEDQRTVVTLQFYEGLSREEIASVMGIDVYRVQILRQSAMRNLKKKMVK